MNSIFDETPPVLYSKYRIFPPQIAYSYRKYCRVAVNSHEKAVIIVASRVVLGGYQKGANDVQVTELNLVRKLLHH